MDLLAYHTDIRIYIIRQCYKRRSWTNFKRTTAYYRFKSWLYCHANNHCRCHPPRHKRFYLRLNVSMIPKWQENLCCSPSIPRLNIMALLIHRQITLPQYHSRQRWPQRTHLLLYSDVTWGFFMCCIDRTKISIHSPCASNDDVSWIEYSSSRRFLFIFLVWEYTCLRVCSNSPLRHVFEKLVTKIIWV